MPHNVCSAADIPEGGVKAFSVGGEKLLIFHLSDGFHATQANCTHLFWPLKGGKIIEDRCVQCPFHHARFDIRSGEVEQWAVRPPGVAALNPLRPPKGLKTWPVREEQGQLSVDMG
ncbi:MAG: Rieske 2Fe-2S domain-containing protein [Salinisphaera sp.]|nr:Rieske 2Fe-2S domain-containing protein [Nevskiaceae bacterium]MDN5938204.1 Rieske 2Fe-2S domain-containing protein [Salinisphaera sp.]